MYGAMIRFKIIIWTLLQFSSPSRISDKCNKFIQSIIITHFFLSLYNAKQGIRSNLGVKRYCV